MGTGDLYALFKARAEAISARVYRAADPAAAGEVLGGIIGELGVAKMVAAPSALVDACLDSANTGAVEVCAVNTRLHAEDAGLGLSEVELAVAETGTLVQDGTDPQQRLVSMLPPVHVALVPTGGLVEQLGEAIALLNQRKVLPGYISFISGPSRTADIERVLTIGVHGPEQLHVIFVDRAGGASDDR